MGLELVGHLLTWAVRGVFVLYAGATLLLLVAIARVKWPYWVKVPAGLLVAGVLIGWPVKWLLAERARDAAATARYQAAAAHFEMRCKTAAGEKILRTVDDVEGLLLLKVRPERFNPYDQNAEDPYGQDLEGDAYIKSFLDGRNAKGRLVENFPHDPADRYLEPWKRHRIAVKWGYRYVDAVDPKDGKRYRYTATVKEVKRKDLSAPMVQQEMRTNPNFTPSIFGFVLEREPAPDPPPRYGVTYEDITTPEERAVWIAGSSLKVIDLHTHEVIAERIGYLFDRGMGSKGGARAPWEQARKWSCPQAPRFAQAREFVEKVLRIKQGDDR